MMDATRFDQSASSGLQAAQRHGCMPTVVVTIGLVVAISGSLFVNLAVDGGIVSNSDRRITLDAEHTVVIHSGPIPTCAFSTTPPHYDCFLTKPARRVFSVDYLTLHGAKSLLWFALPEP